MLISEGKYLKPSKNTRVLAILDSLAGNSGLSQFELGRRLNLSGAMVNQYLRQLQERELVRFLPVNGKSYRYELTASGERSRREMFSDYSSETIRLYTTVKNFVLHKLDPLLAAGRTRLALFGAAETCEVVLSALKGSEFKTVVLLDNDPRKHGHYFNGHVISPPCVLENADCDAVVITSFGRQDEIHQQLESLCTTRRLDIVRL
ncbi:MAG: winged helix-turn-helix transcriptional regulator [Desulfovibrionaceae bacterium]|nr:winged helix-turn-helix transcriptional regulator [Desulfovibrionaceae bacterium]MDD4952502.1 winged helix-turn-helix transcriptional regulator [Desulfovibrionaceae bacterium]